MVAAPHQGTRVLVVEDDFATREMITLVLAGEGYRVAAARNGADALERLKTFERPDIILLDLRMPVMDGCDFCRRRQEDEDLASIPVVVLTAAPELVEQAQTIGISCYLMKPFDSIQLLSTVRRCCGKEATVVH